MKDLTTKCNFYAHKKLPFIFFGHSLPLREELRRGEKVKLMLMKKSESPCCSIESDTDTNHGFVQTHFANATICAAVYICIIRSVLKKITLLNISQAFFIFLEILGLFCQFVNFLDSFIDFRWSSPISIESIIICFHYKSK